MQIGMIGLGRMGANMVRRLLKGGHECVAYDRSPEAVKALAAEGAAGVGSLRELAAAMKPPRAVWIMVPAGIVDGLIAQLRPLLQPGDILIDGGNSHYHDDIRRADELGSAGIHYVDVGTSGGVLGFEHGFCLMIGGERQTVLSLDPVFATLAPGAYAGGTAPAASTSGHAGAQRAAAAQVTPDAKSAAARGAASGSSGPAPASGTAALGYLHCGGHGAGHFVKMVHNGIEYGLMAAYAEGLNLLAHANAGSEARDSDAETAPLSNPRLYRYELDLAAVAEVWRHGSIISSRLLDLTASALASDPGLTRFGGRVSDSGEGRWTVQAAIDVGVPVTVLSAALYSRFESRGRAEFAGKLLSSMRLGFGGHLEKSG